jgi:hypothetical protein
MANNVATKKPAASKSRMFSDLGIGTARLSHMHCAVNDTEMTTISTANKFRVW